ncbi:hypothetical protein KUTeg_004761 [Tegillarca granosa]|uniref:ADP-ribosylhydrolase ARH3 n=1 Tax=Tegillarca granosa TaxID=220873 RepID=A0ABQ9FLP0_TEGGR|nr:hypothetical protein KUTeg_004761 [Tegillarca granosa]
MDSIEKLIFYNHYETLGITPSATQQDIKTAFIQLSKKFDIGQDLINRTQAAGEANNAEKDTDADNASKEKIWKFTDDTAMARNEYFAEPHRGYGASVGVVFQSLKECDCLDLYGPASRQFDGSGSYGNGGAMRISPLAFNISSETEDKNPFERTIIYSISLGGDTDTIATMAGAIAGACYETIFPFIGDGI